MANANTNQFLSMAYAVQPLPQRLPMRPAPCIIPTRKRKVFFSFHFDDVMRVNNVRQAWKIDHPDNKLMRTFYDSSLWETKKLNGDSALKNLIREGVGYTSAVCVLVGTDTWSRRWVRYEIARSVIEKRGLLAIHINRLNHHDRREPDALGVNPLAVVGIYRKPGGPHYLYEKRLVVTDALAGLTEWQWLPYQDHTMPVPLPQYLKSPMPGYVVPLSTGTKVYDHIAEQGHKNIGTWINLAAQDVGR